MTATDDTNRAAILAAVDTYTTNMVAEAVAAQSQTDQTTIAGLQQQLSASQAQVQALQQQINSMTHKTIFSAYPGPIVKDQYDAFPTMANRVAAAFGVPHLPADRLYEEGGYGAATKTLSPIGCASYKQVPGLAAGTSSVVTAVTNELKALAASGKTWYVSCDHEVDHKLENNVYSVATYEAAASRFAQIVRGLGAPNVIPAVCYMGWTFTLNPATTPFHPANYFDPATCDVIALDPYWTPGLTSASAAFDPCYNWAKAQGKKIHVWEVGFYVNGSQPAITEAQVTQRVSDTIAYWKGKADLVLWFEANKSDGNNLLEGHPTGLAEWAAAVQASM